MAQRVLSAEERWRAHVRQVRQTKRDDPNEGLSDRQLDVLLKSEDSQHQVRLSLPSGLWQYPAQRTQDRESAEFLQAVGLIHILKVPEADGTYFGFTPLGVALAQRLGRTP